jgi:hypothetical protein
LLAAVADIGYPAPGAYIVLMAGGFAWLLLRRRTAALLLLAPIAVTFAAAMLRQYPFRDHLILFLVPSFLLGIAAGIDWLRRVAAPCSTAVSAALIAVTLGPALYATASNPPVYQIENIKPVLARLQARKRAGDEVYVYYGAAPAVRFYHAAYRLAAHDYVAGACHRGDNRRYLEELDRFRGSKRLWVVITHAYPRYREREDILGYLDAIGSRREALSVQAQTAAGSGLPAELFLYELSDPNRLRRAAAATFPTTAAEVQPQFTCEHGAQR